MSLSNTPSLKRHPGNNSLGAPSREHIIIAIAHSNLMEELARMDPPPNKKCVERREEPLIFFPGIFQSNFSKLVQNLSIFDMRSSSMQLADIFSLPAAHRLCGAGHDLLVSLPEGFEDICQEELKEKCSNLNIIWVGRGAIRFTTTTKPATLLTSLRSVDHLMAYLAHIAHIDNESMTSDELGEVLKTEYGDTFRPACSTWLDVPIADASGPKPDPFAPDSSLTYRTTSVRKGSHKFTSMDAQKHSAQAMTNYVSHWKAKMKGFDLEILTYIIHDQLWSGIALHPDMLSHRNRTVLGRTTTSAAMYACAYGMARLAEIQPGELIVDPMGGVGMIPIEISKTWRNCRYLCGDINPKDCEAAFINAKNHAGAPVSVVCWDVKTLPLRTGSVDLIVCDMPFGIRHGSHSSNQKLAPKFLDEIWRVLVPETGRALLLTTARNIMLRTLHLQHRKGQWQLLAERFVDVGGFRASIFILARKAASPTALVPLELLQKGSSK